MEEQDYQTFWEHNGLSSPLKEFQRTRGCCGPSAAAFLLRRGTISSPVKILRDASEDSQQTAWFCEQNFLPGSIQQKLVLYRALRDPDRRGSRSGEGERGPPLAGRLKGICSQPLRSTAVRSHPQGSVVCSG